VGYIMNWVGDRKKWRGTIQVAESSPGPDANEFKLEGDIYEPGHWADTLKRSL